MTGSLPPGTSIGLPDAMQCLRIVAPVAGLFALIWLWRNLDWIIHSLVPSLRWERQLGWLNIRAERRASAILRVLAYAVYLALTAGLAGITWGALGLRMLHEWSDPGVLLDIDGHASILLVSLSMWIFYLVGLLPRLRREYELEELERYRAQFSSDEEEDENPRRSFYAGFKSAAPRKTRD